MTLCRNAPTSRLPLVGQTLRGAASGVQERHPAREELMAVIINLANQTDTFVREEVAAHLCAEQRQGHRLHI
jgi:hypothetical protein